MNEHGARQHELLDVEGVEPVDQAAGTLDGYLVIKRIGIARHIVIAREMDDGGDVRSVALTNLGQRSLYAVLRAEMMSTVSSSAGRPFGLVRSSATTR